MNYFQIVKDVIDSWDPESFFPHAPEDEYEIAWQMVEQANEAVEEEATTPQLDAVVTNSESEASILEEDEDIHQLKQSKITFDGYENGVSVEYEPTGEGIKENIS